MESSANSVVLTYLSEGEHSLKVRATDALNNTIESVRKFTVGVENNNDGSVLGEPIVIVALVAAVIAVIGGVAWYVRRKK
jgi:hypothetical protein